jgi:hypothetical protein
MRNGQNKRMRGRNNNHSHGHSQHHGGGHRKNHNPMARVYESNGPEVKIRGNPAHIAEKYMQLARDAQTSGDPVSAENYFQHAEHYFRLIAAAQEQFRLANPHLARPENEAPPQGARDDNFEDGEDDGQQPMMTGGDQPFGTREPQPYVPPNAQPFPQYQQPQPQQQHQPQHQPRPQQSAAPEFQSDVGQLPSFITGGQGQPQPGPQGNGQNGYDNQGGDRFPLHRRRRRHRGPRPHDGGSTGPGDVGE